jgi:hypothetical protein
MLNQNEEEDALNELDTSDEKCNQQVRAQPESSQTIESKTGEMLLKRPCLSNLTNKIPIFDSSNGDEEDEEHFLIETTDEECSFKSFYGCDVPAITNSLYTCPNLNANEHGGTNGGLSTRDDPYEFKVDNETTSVANAAKLHQHHQQQQMTPPKSVESLQQPLSNNSLEKSSITFTNSASIPPISYDDLNNIFEEDDDQMSSAPALNNNAKSHGSIMHNGNEMGQMQSEQLLNTIQSSLSVVMTPPSHETHVSQEDLLLHEQFVNKPTKALCFNDYNTLVSKKPTFISMLLQQTCTDDLANLFNLDRINTANLISNNKKYKKLSNLDVQTKLETFKWRKMTPKKAGVTLSSSSVTTSTTFSTTTTVNQSFKPKTPYSMNTPLTNGPMSTQSLSTLKNNQRKASISTNYNNNNNNNTSNNKQSKEEGVKIKPLDQLNQLDRKKLNQSN